MRIDKSMKAIAFGTRKITYNLHRQDRKRMRIAVLPELTVDVFAPIVKLDRDAVPDQPVDLTIGGNRRHGAALVHEPFQGFIDGVFRNV